MIKSAPFSFVRFEHPSDSDVSLDIPYTLPAYQNHEAAFEFIATIDRAADQDIQIAIGDSAGALVAFFGPAKMAVCKSFRYKLPNLLTYTTFWLNQVSIDGVVTVIGQTVTYEAFQQILFDLGLTLEGEYIISDVSTSVVILADTTDVSGVPTDFSLAVLTEYWHVGYADVRGVAIDPLIPACFTYLLLLPDDSVMGYTNIFRQVDSLEFTSLVTYSCNENGFDFIYDDSDNAVRLPMYLLKPQFPKKREVYRKSDGTQQLLNSLVEKEYELETEQMPEVFHECMAIMLGHDNVTIVCPNIREATVDVIEADTYNPLWEADGVMFAKGKGKLKVSTFSYANSNCS